MRSTFVNSLIELAEENKNIVLFTGDLGYSVLEPFIEKFPDRFYNFGIAEQNMMGAAAGLASEGYHVFVYSIANFPVFRCAEQYRNDVDYHELNVTVVSIGGGVSYGSLGYSHHAIQDYAFMRSMPNTKILAPGDPDEVAFLMRYIVQNPCPSYLRLAKSGEPNLGGFPILRSGIYIFSLVERNKNNVLITTGHTKGYAMDLINRDVKYSEFDVWSLPIWGMRMKTNLLSVISGFSEIITIEDHLLDGGFGSWVNEILLDIPIKKRPDLKIFSFNSGILGNVGDESFLRIQGGLL